MVAYPAILPIFQQNFMLTFCSFDTSVAECDGGKNMLALASLITFLPHRVVDSD
jgi:hypothetical protein